MLERLGTINGGATPIIADLSGGFGSAFTIVLCSDYAREQIVAPYSHQRVPELIKAGSRITAYAPEAAALIAAGAAKIDPMLAAVDANGSRGDIYLSEIVSGLADAMIEQINGGGELFRALAPHLLINASLGGGGA